MPFPRSRSARASLALTLVLGCGGAAERPGDAAARVDATDLDGGAGDATTSDGGALDDASPAVADASPTDVDAASAPDAAAPVGFAGNYSSPSIVRVGEIYHVYFAQQSLGGRHYHTPHATFTEDGNFTFVGEALPSMGADADASGPTWAPGVARIDATHWVLYYTAHLSGTTSKKCLFRAHASGPDGPFVDDYAAPLYCADGGLWSIDAYPVEDAHGVWRLSARIDQPGGINTIALRELGALGAHFAAGSSWLELTHNAPTSWEQPVMENAGIVRLTPPTAEPHWFVFYSGRAWDDDSYAIGYADCGPGLSDGACTRVTTGGPWLATDAANDVFAPGTPTFYTNRAGDTMMSVQAWEHTGGTSNPRNHGQIMRTYRMTIDDGYRPTAHLVRVDL